MSDKEYYCKNCDDVYGPTSDLMDKCPNCQLQLETPVPSDFYERHPECLYISKLLREEDDLEANSESKDDVLKKVMNEVMEEYKRATSKFLPMNSPHEGWAVIREEVDELWDAVKRNDKEHAIENMREEAIQVAAMGIRFLTDIVYAKKPKERRANELGL